MARFWGPLGCICRAFQAAVTATVTKRRPITIQRVSYTTPKAVEVLPEDDAAVSAAIRSVLVDAARRKAAAPIRADSARASGYAASTRRTLDAALRSLLDSCAWGAANTLIRKGLQAGIVRADLDRDEFSRQLDIVDASS